MNLSSSGLAKKMNLSSSGLALLKKLEGFSAIPYPDSGNKLTIGYGHLIQPMSHLLHATLTEQEATDLLLQDIAHAEQAVNNVPFVTLPTQNQFDALVIFVYNIGPYAFNSSMMRKILIGKKSGNAAAQFDKWVYVKVGGEKGLLL
jgi:GH24 family phage-related lysozyme (muramidase)